MVILASQLLQTLDVTRLWLVATVLAAVLPPTIAWLIRRRRRLAVWQLLLGVAVLGVALACTGEELYQLLGHQLGYGPFGIIDVWPFERERDPHPCEVTMGVLIVSSIFTFGVYFRRRTTEESGPLPHDAEPVQEPQTPPVPPRARTQDDNSAENAAPGADRL
jgi:hypothetical protein